jgi:hypothetical protein
MIPISRKVAEDLIENSNPVDSRIDQNSGTINIVFVLENGKSLIVEYDRQVNKRSYFLGKELR